MDEHIAYYRRRAADEARRALRASAPQSAAIHAELAAHYRAKVRGFAPHGNELRDERAA